MFLPIICSPGIQDETICHSVTPLYCDSSITVVIIKNKICFKFLIFTQNDFMFPSQVFEENIEKTKSPYLIKKMVLE